MDLELHGGVSTHLDSLRIAACETRSFVLSLSSFVSICCMAKALSKSPTMGVMLASNTEIWHLVTSRPYWVHGQRALQVWLFASSHGKRAVQFDLIRAGWL